MTSGKPKKKIALIGSAPSSIAQAPFNDPSWTIWVCSPGAVPHIRRCDLWFELHRFEPPNGPTGPKPWFTKEYIDFMAGLPCPVMMIDKVPELANSVPYPKREVMAYEYLPRAAFTDTEGKKREVKHQFFPHFWTSSLSWMFALAIVEGADEIGLWGVDMSAQEEWFFQRSGCHYFINVAKQIGITVTIPHESDLIRPPPLYGFCEVDPMHIKFLRRAEELQMHYHKAEKDVSEATNRFYYYKGAIDDLEYMKKTWVSDAQAIEMTYASPDLPEASTTEPPLMTPLANGEAPHGEVLEIEILPPPKVRKRKGRNGRHVEAEAVVR